MMASYVADLPEMEDIMFLKRKSVTQSLCHRCMVNRIELADIKCGTSRSKCKSMELVEGTRNVQEKDEVLAQWSMLRIVQFFIGFLISDYIHALTSITFFAANRCICFH